MRHRDRESRFALTTCLYLHVLLPLLHECNSAMTNRARERHKIREDREKSGAERVTLSSLFARLPLRRSSPHPRSLAIIEFIDIPIFVLLKILSKIVSFSILTFTFLRLTLLTVAACLCVLSVQVHYQYPLYVHVLFRSGQATKHK